MRLFIISLFTILCLTSCRDGEAKSASSNNQNYQATTVDECINEKECVWSAFAEFIMKPDETLETAVIKKWNMPLRIAVLGAEDRSIWNKLEELSKKFSSPTSLNIKVTPDDFNIMVVVSDDFKKDTLETYDSVFKVYYKSLVFDYFNNNPSFPNASRLTLPYYDKDKNYVTTVMYVKKNVSTEHDLSIYFYGILGLRGLVSMPNLTDYSFSEIDDLKLILLQILYHKDIEAGMSLSEVKQNFNEIYHNVSLGFTKDNKV